MRLILAGNDPGNPEDLLVPIGRVLHVIPRGTTIKDIDELPYRMGGRAATPKEAIMLRAADGTPTFIPGGGVTEAAELQDIAYKVHEKNQQRRLFNREELGLVSDFDSAFREALQDRIRQHKANPVTDPARTPGWAGRRLF